MRRGKYSVTTTSAGEEQEIPGADASYSV